MKKAYELATLTGTQVLLLVASETGHVYTFATPKLQPLITKPEGKSFIQSCLNTPDDDAPQDFDIRAKSDVPDFQEADYMAPSSSYMPPAGHQQQYFNGNGYPPYAPGEPPHSSFSSSSHYGGGREQFEYSEYPSEYRGEYHGEFQVHPSEPYPPSRHLSYPGGRGGPSYPPPGPHSHDYPHPPPHGHMDHPPSHHPGGHSGYHPDYSRDYPPHQPEYRGYGHPYPDKYGHEYGRPEYDPGQGGYEPPHGGPLDMGQHPQDGQNGYMHPHDQHSMPKEEPYEGQ